MDALALRNDMVEACVRVLIKEGFRDVHPVIADALVDRVEDETAFSVRVDCKRLPGFLVAAPIGEVKEGSALHNRAGGTIPCQSTSANEGWNRKGWDVVQNLIGEDSIGGHRKRKLIRVRLVGCWRIGSYQAAV